MIAADAADRLIDARYLAASAAATEYVRFQAARVLDDMGDWSAGARGFADELRSRLGIVPAAAGALSWLVHEAEAGGYSPGTAGEADRERTTRLLDAHTAIVGSSREMIDLVADRYPSVLRGERSALSVLFKGEGLRLWERYFSAANPLYDVHNRLAADGCRAAWPLLPERRRILELGTGTGGATAAILSALTELTGGADADFIISDISPSFLIRVAERFRSSRPSLRSMRIDFSRALEEQGLARGTVDLVVATNALHAAPDLRTTLDSLRTVLAQGGVLVISESLCPPDGAVHQEFVFNLLGGGASRGRSRFLDSTRWRDVLHAAGWTSRTLVNRSGPELAMLAFASDRPATIATIAPAES